MLISLKKSIKSLKSMKIVKIERIEVIEVIEIIENCQDWTKYFKEVLSPFLNVIASLATGHDCRSRQMQKQINSTKSMKSMIEKVQ